jgi:hypothetical protein
MITSLALTLLAAITTPARSPSDRPPAALAEPTGEQILSHMRSRYAGKWYHNMTFVQKTTAWDSTGKTTITTWYESLTLPGTIRIDFGNPADGNGVLATRDSTFVVQHGTLSGKRAGGNVLLTLAFDVYVAPLDRTVASLQGAGYDLSKVHEETWQGTPVYVVGADSGNLNTPQFWIDTKQLVLVRIFTPVQPGSTVMRDVRFQQWHPIGGGLIAPRVEMYVGSKMTRLEEYSDIKVNVALNPDLFDVTKWTTAPNWARSAGGQ